MANLGEQSFWRLLLSHHTEDKLHLCYRMGWGNHRVAVCARCLGLYPAMVGALLVGRATGPWPEWLEWTLLLLAPIPALLEWGTTVASGRPERPNAVRLSTGIGLGLSLGASLHVNTYALFSAPVRAQLLLLLASIWVVWLASYFRRFRARLAKIRQLNRERQILGRRLMEELERSKERRGGDAEP
ncbi:MAG: DUF2085 domain-containing protein [Deltaproteobacteria bacterium]|nr:MAG: DUF2085 domain-containing protein [Deltaproteobacteria bacterium]